MIVDGVNVSATASASAQPITLPESTTMPKSFGFLSAVAMEASAAIAHAPMRYGDTSRTPAGRIVIPTRTSS